MLPKTTTQIPATIKVVQQPSKTFRMDLENRRIIGFVDGLEAVTQTIYCTLGTERYEHLIYSWNHGAELHDLTGKSIPYVKSELKRRISEALIQDDRINGVDSFEFTVAGRKLAVKFVVRTTIGDLPREMEVEI